MREKVEYISKNTIQALNNILAFFFTSQLNLIEKYFWKKKSAKISVYFRAKVIQHFRKKCIILLPYFPLTNPLRYRPPLLFAPLPSTPPPLRTRHLQYTSAKNKTHNKSKVTCAVPAPKFL